MCLVGLYPPEYIYSTSVYCDAFTGCDSSCEGLEQCISSMASDCCNYYTLDGSCTISCPSPFVPLANNTCGCRPGTILFPGNICDCPPGFTGPQCDVVINPCTATSCINGGTCSPLGGGTFECICPAGLEGSTCQTDINECMATPSPCLNGGTCTNSFGSYMCSCQGEWQGQDCGSCGIANCTTCSTDGTTCMQCAGGFVFNSENTCCKSKMNSISCKSLYLSLTL